MTLAVPERTAVLRTPKLTDIATLVRVLEQNPFGSLILLLLLLGVALIVWAAR
jgi:hypothetical protein